MQVSSTLIAAQQAAREAQARFHSQVAPGFSAALEQASGKTGGFSPLPLRQTAPAPVAAAPAPAGPASRPGSMLDIKI
jgi:hypothetical protein